VAIRRASGPELVPTIEQLAELSAAERAAIVARLDEATHRRGYVWQPGSLFLVLRDHDDIVGGLIGQLHWEWLRIEILAVAEALRGRGWGRRLVEEAERLAVAAGCRRAWVDTFSFQAPGFYERLGYRRFGELPDYPSGHTRCFYAKLLAPARAAT
jgi:ribosomal protein S18 acetylase RimI-like enzyme